MSYSSENWMELNATGPGFNLPATSIDFKVPVNVTPSGAPTINQVGYTAKAPATTIGALTTTTPTLIQSMTLGVGTWLITSNVTFKTTANPTTYQFLGEFLEHPDYSIAHSNQSYNPSESAPLNALESSNLSGIVQLTTPAIITHFVEAVFSAGGFTISSDPHLTYMHATRLS